MSTVEREPLTRLEELRATQERLLGEIGDLEAFIDSSPVREQEARVDLIRRYPGKLPGVGQDEAQTEVRKRKEAEGRLASARSNLAAIVGLIEEERLAHREQELRR